MSSRKVTSELASTPSTDDGGVRHFAWCLVDISSKIGAGVDWLALRLTPTRKNGDLLYPLVRLTGMNVFCVVAMGHPGFIPGFPRYTDIWISRGYYGLQMVHLRPCPFDHRSRAGT